MKSKSSNVEQRRRRKQKKEPVVRSNPFELRINKQKFSILGRKTKNDKGLPGLSRSKAIKKRKATLLQEYNQGNKVTNFVDKRFGEFSNELSLEEKMLKRFTLEKKKHHESRKLYNLDDEEELTHYGQSLGDMTTFDDADLQLTDDENEEDRTEEDNFGGFLRKVDNSQENQEVDKQKSKKEIMEDVVAKSKLKKLERQQAKEEAFILTQDLDSDWKVIQDLLDKTGYRATVKADDYDILVNELKYDMKAKPKERMKTEEEIAKAEKEKLEELEAARVERMYANETGRSLHLSADYLGESHVMKKDKRVELVYKDGKAVVFPEGIAEARTTTSQKHDKKAHEDNDSMSGADYEEEDEDQSEDDDNDDDDDDDDDGDDADDDDDDDDNEEKYDEKYDENCDRSEDKEKQSNISKDDNEYSATGENEHTVKGYTSGSFKGPSDTSPGEVNIPPKIRKEAFKELPFTFPAPNNLDEFLAIVNKWSQEEKLCIIDRIRKCHPPKLEAKNKKKMEVFFDVIFEYINYLCEEEPVPISFINKLAKPLFGIIKDCPHYCTSKIQLQIRNTFKKFWMQCQVAGARDAMPGIKEIILLTLIAKVFPTSDLKHGITSPALTYMAAVLSKAYLNSAADLISGLFVSNIILEFISLSRRFVPEVVNFITGILSLATKPDCGVKYTLTLRMHVKNRHCLCLSKKTENIAKKLCLPDMENKRKVVLRCLEPETRVAVLRSCVQLLKKFAAIYKDLPSYAEIFDHARQLSDCIPYENYPKEVQQELSKVSELLRSVEERQPLTMLARKPVPLPLLEPMFDECYEMKPKKRTKNKDINERNKLKYKVKSEMKGAVREIRKDSQFLAKQKLDERIKKDKERMQRTKEIEKQLGEQQGELKSLKRMKKKKN